MIDWNKITKSHTVKMARCISHRWWGVDIKFYDKNGYLRDDDIPYQNELCHLIYSTESSNKNCVQNYKKKLKGLNKTQNAFSYKCNAGLYGVTVPIIMNNEYVGAMVASGMQSHKKDPRRSMYIDDLTKLGLDNNIVKQSYNSLKDVNGHSEEYLLEFMELVTNDVMALYGMLQKEYDNTKNQDAVLEKVYDGKYNQIIGASPAIKTVFDTLDMIESSESPVLIYGESGAGKELIAAAVHYNSPRKDNMFVIQNCSAFSETLLSSELFGHEKGSFTSAIAEKKGLFEIADNGTLFLDEIGDMNIEVQARLLRVLENGTFYRVGGTKQKSVDVRIIAATNRNLKIQVELGQFRKDLFYRINTLHVTMPPLRERKEDIALLANHFSGIYTKNRSIERKDIRQDVIELLMAYDWPGNVRELKSIAERMIMLSGKSNTICLNHVPMEIKEASCPETRFINLKKNANKLKDTLKTIEKEIIEEKLKSANWNKSLTSRELGISRASLNNKISEFNILQQP